MDLLMIFPICKKSMENSLQPWVSKLQNSWWLTALHKLDLHKFPRMAILEGLPWNFSASRFHPWWHLQLWCLLHLMKILFQTLELFLCKMLGDFPTYQDGQACHHQPWKDYMVFNRSSRRKRGMASYLLFIIPDFFCIFPMNFAMATLGLKEFSHFLQT